MSSVPKIFCGHRPLSHFFRAHIYICTNKQNSTIMANNNYPSYLPDDFRGLESIQEGNQRYYYKKKDGHNLLIGSIVGKRHLVIRFPEGSTIDVIPPDSIGTDEIRDGSVGTQDLSPDAISNHGDIDEVFRQNH